MSKQEKIYPIYFKGKLWREKDCADVFVCFYHSKDSLDFMQSVYVGDGLRIQPDGTWWDEEEDKEEIMKEFLKIKT